MTLGSAGSTACATKVESARRVVELQVATPVQERIDALAERANDGAPSDDERFLKLKARQQLDSKIQ